MALSWDCTKVKDCEKLHEDEAEWMVTETLIWVTMATGIGRITEASAPEFYARLHVLEREGSWLTETVTTQHYVNGWHRLPATTECKPRPITPKDVQRRIGLQTNVSSESRAKWRGRFTRHLDEAVRSYARVTK